MAEEFEVSERQQELENLIRRPAYHLWTAHRWMWLGTLVLGRDQEARFAKQPEQPVPVHEWALAAFVLDRALKECPLGGTAHRDKMAERLKAVLERYRKTPYIRAEDEEANTWFEGCDF